MHSERVPIAAYAQYWYALLSIRSGINSPPPLPPVSSLCKLVYVGNAGEQPTPERMAEKPHTMYPR